MTDYRNRECSVCRRVGGIEHRTADLYVCKHCGTPFRSRAMQQQEAPMTKTGRKSHGVERFVWFDYEDSTGAALRGLYDCPRLEPEEIVVREPDKKRLEFLKYLVREGLLNDEEDTP